MGAQPLLFPARMRHDRGKSMNTSRRLVLLAATASLMLLPAGHASAAPAVDEYGANLPTAGGHKSQGTSVPKANPEQLPPSVAKSLNNSPDAKKLKAVATADALGAPQTRAGSKPGGESAGSDDDSDAGFVSAAAGTITSPLVLLLIAALALSGIAAWRVSDRRA